MNAGDLPALMAVAFRSVMDTVHEQLAEQGFGDVRPAHGFVFQLLSHSRGSTAVEIAAHLGVTKQAATQLVADLEKRGYVRRTAHPTDRRARLVVLAERGWDCIGAVEREWAAIETRWTELIGADGVAALHRGLSAIVREAAAQGPVLLRPLW